MGNPATGVTVRAQRHVLLSGGTPDGLSVLGAGWLAVAERYALSSAKTSHRRGEGDEHDATSVDVHRTPLHGRISGPRRLSLD